MVAIEYLKQMISIEQIRILEPSLQNAPDEVVIKIREKLYDLARLGIEDYLEEHGSNFPLGGQDVKLENKM